MGAQSSSHSLHLSSHPHTSGGAARLASHPCLVGRLGFNYRYTIWDRQAPGAWQVAGRQDPIPQSVGLLAPVVGSLLATPPTYVNGLSETKEAERGPQSLPCCASSVCAFSGWALTPSPAPPSHLCHFAPFSCPSDPLSSLSGSVSMYGGVPLLRPQSTYSHLPS